ncbi:DUF4870 domain-containing protein [Marisediminicola senii]|uniref:DUF4870 domain-containing protein n=1 Tax=Marisediminicola senii TaxID=2711233 RepID=UPI0013E9B33F|nr:DUF4870 domain-containing protein [Marisediminicola senii]
MTNPYYQPPQQLSPSDEKMWSTLVHVGGIFLSFLPALIAYLVLKDRGPFVRHHTATALNFQLTMLLAGIVGSILASTFILALIGAPLLVLVFVLVVVFSIIAAVASNNGQWYSYPLAIQFVK